MMTAPDLIDEVPDGRRRKPCRCPVVRESAAGCGNDDVEMPASAINKSEKVGGAAVVRTGENARGWNPLQAVQNGYKSLDLLVVGI